MITVAIPTSKMVDGDKLFTRCLESLWNQTYQDFEIVVTDNSDDNGIEDICAYYKTGIKYYRNPIKGMAQNTNEAIRRSKGKLIKLLYMDDYLTHEESLRLIVDNFKGNWLVSGCTHVSTNSHGVLRKDFNDHMPYYSPDIIMGNNTIGSPSVLTIRNKEPLFFDEEMTWLLDADYYYRLYGKYGEPIILKDINVTIGIHAGQATNTMGNERKLQEHHYLAKKYA